MADVTFPTRDDRGQLLLVGAFALAVLFVSLALLLNTAIYTGNLATRDAGVEAADAVAYVSESRAAGIEAIESVNYRNNTTHGDLNAALRATVNAWDDAAAHHRAVSGALADVDVVGVTNGTRIEQDNASRNFTSADGTENWTLAADAELSGVRSLRLTVDESRLADSPADVVAEDVFHVTISSDAGTQSLYVYDTDGAPEVRVVVDGTETTCAAGSVTDGTFVIDVPNGSVGGAPCEALTRVDDVSESTAVRFRDGDTAGGTYTMVVDEPISSPGLASPGTGDPYATPAIYNATFHVTYRTEGLDYGAQIRVIPP